MKLTVLDWNNKALEEVTLSEEIFAQVVRGDILEAAIRYQLLKRRKGCHKTKGISEISGTTKKPYAQKGTGRARQGSLRSPQFRGGAVIFGPVVRDHSISLNKKFRKLALKHALSSKAVANKLMIIDDINFSEPKTSSLKKSLEMLNIKNVLVVDINEQNSNFRMACSNLIGIDVIPTKGLNVYDIVRHDCLIINKNALIEIEERLK